MKNYKVENYKIEHLHYDAKPKELNKVFYTEFTDYMRVNRNYAVIAQVCHILDNKFKLEKNPEQQADLFKNLTEFRRACRKEEEGVCLLYLGEVEKILKPYIPIEQKRFEQAEAHSKTWYSRLSNKLGLNG